MELELSYRIYRIFDTRYFLDTNGVIRYLESDGSYRIVNPHTPSKSKYAELVCRIDGRVRHFSIHRLLAQLVMNGALSDNDHVHHIQELANGGSNNITNLAIINAESHKLLHAGNNVSYVPLVNYL